MYSLLSDQRLLCQLPKLKMLNIVPELGNACNSNTSVFFAVSILVPYILALRSSMKMYSCLAIGGSFSCGTTLSRNATDPEGWRSATQRGRERVGQVMKRIKSVDRKSGER